MEAEDFVVDLLVGRAGEGEELLVDMVVERSALGSGLAFGVPFVNTDQMHIGTRLSTTLKEFFQGAIDQFHITPNVMYTDNFVVQPASANDTPTLVRLQWQEPVSGGLAVSYDVFRSVNNGAFQLINSNRFALSWEAP